MANRIQFRRDTAANWTAANPTLALGEPGHETDTGRRKIGDGVTAWTSLAYQFDKATADTTYAPQPLAGLRAWKAGLAGRSYAPADIVIIGDSVSEGQGAAVKGRRYAVGRSRPSW
ncbi:hypothetical protein [Sinomonas gamaensis]|uniref:hyaluronate lyase N-terminal domain-containing protein n=1 Tax=Sinomonas gamaensis TaxID=2565624 RepID=UPI00110910F3|nr:hypothetical protein [Sinomonas gamaensis]